MRCEDALYAAAEPIGSCERAPLAAADSSNVANTTGTHIKKCPPLLTRMLPPCPASCGRRHQCLPLIKPVTPPSRPNSRGANHGLRLAACIHRADRMEHH